MHNSALLGKSRPLAVKKICVVEIRITKRRGSTAAALYIGTQPTVRGYFPDTRLKKKESFGNERRKKKLSEEIRGPVKKLIQVKSKANSRFLPTVSLAFGANWLGPVDCSGECSCDRSFCQLVVAAQTRRMGEYLMHPMQWLALPPDYWVRGSAVWAPVMPVEAS